MDSASQPKKSGSNECCTTRNVLWHLVFAGFAVNYMLRTNLNIAIVSMVQPKPSNNLTLTSECLSNYTLPAATNQKDKLSTQGDETILVNVTKIQEEYQKFDWNEKEQSHALGSFFWLHWVTQVPGGILATKYGTKVVFGLANFTAVLCCFLMPSAAFMGYQYLVAIRILQGLLAGFSWPAMHNMTARWIPPNERSKFVTAYLGSSVGAALTYPVCGFIIQRWGWELAFHACGVMGTLWFICWWCLVYDSPVQHPRISKEEREYIVASLGQSYTKDMGPIPWKDILLSVPVWMNVLAQWGGMWGLFTLMTHAPSYFKFIHGWSIQATGLLSGLGHILRTLWSYVSGEMSDYFLRTNRMSRTNVRKLATAFCTIGQGFCMLFLATSGCDHIWAVVWLSASIAMNGSTSSGPLSCIVDLSPNYASVILGVVNSVVALVGFITPAVVGHLTYQNQTVGQWQKVFWIASAMMIGTGTLFMIFAQSELQPWNTPNRSDAKQSELESMKLETATEENKQTAVTIMS